PMYFWDFQDSLDDAERGERRLSSRAVLRRLLSEVGQARGALLRAAGLLVLAATADLAGPQILRQVLNAAATGASEGHIARLALLYVAVVAGSLGLGYAMAILLSCIGLRLVTDLKERLFRHLLGLNVRFFHDYSPGILLARVEGDTERLKQLFSNATARLAQSLLLLVGILGVMLLEDWRTTLAVLGCLLALGAAASFFVRIAQRLYREARKRYADVTAFIAEYVQAVDVVQQHGYEEQVKARLRALSSKKLRADSLAQLVEYSFWGVFSFFEILATVTVIAVGSRKVVSGTMDLGTLVMLVEYLRQIFVPILAISELVSLVQQALVSAERVFGLLEKIPDEPRDLAAAAARQRGERERQELVPGVSHADAVPAGPAEPEVPFAHVLRFEAVSFAYEHGRDVLREISFDLRRGERVALVGPSGGGKSTLANLLLRFYEPTSGRISVDGVDLRTYPRRAWRRRIGLVLQGVHLFPGTLRDNLTVFDGSRAEGELWRALGIVQASALASGLAGGLDAELAERGANLSQGERQLVSFARALVHDPPVLVLDEATASVDALTERLIQQGLDSMLAGRTVLIIAHRLATAARADRILVILDGRIAESGTHAELYQLGGHYRRLFDLQYNAASEATAP
ncbi:MAG: ABC transporter ATP-binding protein, partial [Candidatus Schekmanbacteria bacterium]|nr:ABC transporter ATP-binding protein [Candidatus Schekmanbacteria bacterium]